MLTKLISKACALAFAVSWLVVPGAAAQTMTLRVPFRGAVAMQTAATIIEFDASSIAGGATVSVASLPGPPVVVPVPASPCAGVACLAADTTSAGDDVVVRRISGTTRARLELTYLASFTAPYCAPIGGLADRDFEITLSGFTNNGRRMTSFMAPSNASCDIPYARVPSNRPFFAAGAPPANLGRLPVNVVLVLDKSPSMAWVVPNSADIRWDRLRASVQQFTAVWDVVGAPPPPATVSSEGHTEDKLGLIFFSAAASESPLDGGSFFKTRDADVAPWSATVTAALDAATLSSGTGIGAGATSGKTRLGDVDEINGDTAMVLFTDGEQNTPPCLVHLGETLSPTVKPYPGLPGQFYTDQCTVAAPVQALLTFGGVGTPLAQGAPRGPIYTIGLGEGGMAAGAVLLDEVSQQTAGRAQFPNNGPAMDTAFVDGLVEHLKGGTVSQLARTFGTVPAGPGDGPPLIANVDPSVTRVVFVLGWEGRAREVDLEIRQPNGTLITPPLFQPNPNSRVAAVNIPQTGPSGDWQARLVRRGDTGPVTYHLSAYAVESRLSSRVTESARLGTGDPLTIVAEVGWDGPGLDGLPDGAIRATIERPAENLGNALHKVLDLGGGGQRPQNVLADTSPVMLKIGLLAAGSGLLGRVEPSLPVTVPLRSVGMGRYEGTFDGAVVGGKYRVRVDFDWDDPRTNRIRRITLAERQVPVLPSADDSVVDVRRDDEGVVLLITPKDRFGNFVGPGFENKLGVLVDGIAVGPPTDPEVIGTYQVRLAGVPPGADPEVKVVYGDETLFDEPLSSIDGDDTGGDAGALAVWLALGATFPTGSFDDDADGSLAGTIGFEHQLRPTVAVEGTIGLHQFKGKNGTPDTDVTELGLGTKWYFNAGAFKPFVTVGAGVYAFDPGVTRLGIDAGVGVQRQLTPPWSLEGRCTLHNVLDNSPRTRYSVLQLGLRYQF